MVIILNKKGVSPIVATLLLILVAVAAAVVLYAWVSGLSSSAKSSGAERTGIAFEIEAAKLEWNSNYTSGSIVNTTLVNATVFIRNIGSMPIENGTWSLYILYPVSGTIIPDNTSSFTFTVNRTLAPGEIVNATVLFMNSTVFDNVVPGHYYTIKVVSPQGVSDSTYVKCENVTTRS